MPKAMVDGKASGRRGRPVGGQWAIRRCTRRRGGRARPVALARALSASPGSTSGHDELGLLGPVRRHGVDPPAPGATSGPAPHRTAVGRERGQRARRLPGPRLPGRGGHRDRRGGLPRLSPRLAPSALRPPGRRIEIVCGRARPPSRGRHAHRASRPGGARAGPRCSRRRCQGGRRRRRGGGCRRARAAGEGLGPQAAPPTDSFRAGSPSGARRCAPAPARRRRPLVPVGDASTGRHGRPVGHRSHGRVDVAHQLLGRPVLRVGNGEPARRRPARRRGPRCSGGAGRGRSASSTARPGSRPGSSGQTAPAKGTGDRGRCPGRAGWYRLGPGHRWAGSPTVPIGVASAGVAERSSPWGDPAHALGVLGRWSGDLLAARHRGTRPARRRKPDRQPVARGRVDRGIQRGGRSAAAGAADQALAGPTLAFSAIAAGDTAPAVPGGSASSIPVAPASAPVGNGAPAPAGPDGWASPSASTSPCVRWP